MTTEEVIKTLEINLKNVSVFAYDKIINLIISLGLYGDALIRPDRKGCEYCNDTLKNYRYINACDIIPKYCQICGRKLTEESWADLERRINDGTAD